jgi:ABC-2 type transport system ATP-binding protein
VSDPVVQTHELTKVFGAVTAVSKLSISLDPGQILGFLGPNGAGKSTTIRMLMGALHPTSGSATVLGRHAGDVATHRRIGYLPGGLRVDPTLSGADLFAWYGRLRGRVDARVVDALCERLGLDPSRRFGALSRGNRQKVGIVQAFCHVPDLLILDEPSSGLDPIAQREFLALLKEAASRGAAVLFSSHVLPEVEHAATHVAIIRAGELVTYATVADLLDRSRRHLELRYAKPPLIAAFQGVSGVVDVAVDGVSAVLTIDGAVGPALRAATDAGTVLRVAPTGDDLEDLFIALYPHQCAPTEVG